MAIIKMILLIGLLIFVHELGHFLVARMFKMKVEKFCFGLPFGPILFEKKIGDVTYGIHWLFFLGGYVSFPDDNKDNGLSSDSSELFKNKPIYQRACVLAAGVTANLITAYILVIFCCLHWGELPSGQYDIFVNNFVESTPKTTLNSGLKPGDKIYSINGKKVEYYNELELVTAKSKKFDGIITPKRYEKVLSEFLKQNPKLNENDILKQGQVVSIPEITPEDKVILTNADIFGLKNKNININLSDVQKSIRDDAYDKKTYELKQEIPIKDFAAAIADTYSPIDIVAERNGELAEIKTLTSGIDGKIGVMPRIQEREVKINSFAQALKTSNDYMWRNTKLMFWSLKLLITGQVPMDKMTSIVAVTKIGSDIIEKSGMLKGLLLTAIISLNLAILNIMPIPVLDGGHLLFLTIEKIKGSPVDEKIIERISNIFFYLLIALMLFFIGNDICSIWIKKIY